MAYAAHALNVLSPHAALDQLEPICWFTLPAELIDGVPASVLHARATALRNWQEGTASWAGIAAHFAHALKLPDVAGTTVS